MSSTLEKRVAALEAIRKASLPNKIGGVVICTEGETPEQAIERAERQGRSGSFLVVPEIMTEEAWETMMSNSRHGS